MVYRDAVSKGQIDAGNAVHGPTIFSSRWLFEYLKSLDYFLLCRSYLLSHSDLCGSGRYYRDHWRPLWAPVTLARRVSRQTAV